MLILIGRDWLVYYGSSCEAWRLASPPSAPRAPPAPCGLLSRLIIPRSRSAHALESWFSARKTRSEKSTVAFTQYYNDTEYAGGINYQMRVRRGDQLSDASTLWSHARTARGLLRRGEQRPLLLLLQRGRLYLRTRQQGFVPDLHSRLNQP